MKSKDSIFFFFLILLAQRSLAQVIVTDGAVLSIPPNITFYASGDFVNNGKILNNGSLVVAGSWTNTGDYEAESGQVTFSGGGPQVINHNAQSFAKLIIGGGGQKIFRADIFITQELTLQQGILSTDNHSKITMDQQAIITGGSATSYVQGPVYTTGTGAKFYPVGINSNYLPLTFSNVTGTTPVVGIEVIEPNPDTKIDPSLKSVSALRYWQVSTQSGTFSGSPVEVSISGEDPSALLVVAQAESINDPFRNLGGSVTAESVTSTDPVTQALIAIGIERSKDLIVYNAVTPGNNDGKHDFLKIVNIDLYPDNEVTIINRAGDKVFQISGYNNIDRIFNGEGNAGGTKALSDGTYFYVIDKKNGDKKISGFFILRR